MSTENLIGLILSILVLGYLLAALLFPEMQPRERAADRKRP